jgi:ABC-type Fe3+-siderophore transport system permease subunit
VGVDVEEAVPLAAPEVAAAAAGSSAVSVLVSALSGRGRNSHTMPQASSNAVAITVISISTVGLNKASSNLSSESGKRVLIAHSAIAAAGRSIGQPISEPPER